MNDIYRSFSERHGYSEPRSLQLEDMDDDLRNSLWNVCHQNFPEDIRRRMHPMYMHIWVNFLKKPADELDTHTFLEGNAPIKQCFLSGFWVRIYDLVEFVVQAPTSIINDSQHTDLVAEFNMVLEREHAAFRIVDGLVIPITSKEEIESIETASNAPFDSVKKHIHQALVLLSDRENPDYRNSIKESISAVESLAKEITGNSKGTLGQLTSDLNLHPAFSEGLNKLYGFTSNAKGIRHGGTGQLLEPDQSTARFMLIICSAFVNYIIQQQNRQN